ncbi:MAG: DUF1573 domain-containing protein [Flavobacteriales bacterium]|nr:DUF1573 domain-containing protein [Flavobacteriales bacterium]
MLLTTTMTDVNGQSLEQWTYWGDAAMTKGEYYGASRFYAGALQVEPGRMSLQWKQAEASRLSNQYILAAELYEKVHRKDMGRTYKNALRWLGEMQLCTGAYDDAERTWLKVLEKEKDQSSPNAIRARQAIIGCAIAKDPMRTTDNLELEHLPGPVNTYDSEFGARIGPDSTLYFTSLRGELNEDGEVIDTVDYHARIFVARPNASGWSEPKAIVASTHPGELANTTWTVGGKWVLFTYCPPDERCRIHAGFHSGDDLMGAGPQSGLGDEMSTQPMIVEHAGGQRLYFVSDRAGGSGGMDIWQADLREGEALNVAPVGAPVNSPGNEQGPWFDHSTGKLWFASDWHPGHGGYDIFHADLRSDGSFGDPVNAGRPINSPANDLYPCIDEERGEGWLTSNRVGSYAAKGETCCNDLYRLNWKKPIPGITKDTAVVIPLQGPTTGPLEDILSGTPLKLYFHNDEPEPRSWATSTGQSYRTTYRKYEALWPEYFAQQSDPTAIRSFFEREVAKGLEDLQRLEKALLPLLQQGEHVTLEVRGHASPLAKNVYNKNLSMRRIGSLRSDLRTAMNGAFVPFMDSTAAEGGVLRLKELPFGEDESASGVSDDLNDLKNSVYSASAARERRIEVERILFTTPERNVDVDLGLLQQSVEKVHPFPILNTNPTPLNILGSRSECDCTFMRVPEGPVPPGGSADTEIIFTGRAQPGPLFRRIIVITDGVPERIILNIRGTVVE